MMRIPITILIGLLLAVLFSCEKEESGPCPCTDPENPTCVNYDPCYQLYPANADFKIYEVPYDRTGFIDTVIETDTVLWSNLALFEPVQQYYDSLKWIVGAETLTSHTVTRSSFPKEQFIDITLIVFKPSALTCFPDSIESDTVTKSFYSAENSLIFEQSFIGTHLNAGVSNQVVSYDPSFFGRRFGLPYFCDRSEIPGVIAIGYKHLITASADETPSSGSCYRLNSVAEMISGDSIRIEYQYKDTAFVGLPAEKMPWVKDVFLGKRL